MRHRKTTAEKAPTIQANVLWEKHRGNVSEKVHHGKIRRSVAKRVKREKCVRREKRGQSQKCIAEVHRSMDRAEKHSRKSIRENTKKQKTHARFARMRNAVRESLCMCSCTPMFSIAREL
jgi:hypothetical protein